jgi:hypothetical protein
MIRRIVPIAALWSLSVIASCGAFGSNGAPVAGGDGGDGPVDAAADANMNPQDGAPPPAPDSGSRSFCATHAGVFCEDFEADPLSAGKWIASAPNPRATLDRVARPGDPTNMALHARTVSIDTTEVIAALYHGVPAGFHHVVYSYDVFVAELEAADPAAYPRPRVSSWESSTAYTWVDIERTQSTTAPFLLYGWGNQPQIPVNVTGPAPFLSGVWHRIRVEITRASASSATFTVTWEGVPAAGPPTPLATKLDDTETQSLVIGTSVSFPATIDLLYDNVLIEALDP